jgi:DNA replication protein DnaD
LESEDDYPLDENDLLVLLASEIFNSQQKIDILLNADKEVIKGGWRLCNQACRILANYEYVELESNLLLAIIANAQVIEDRLKLLNIHIHSLSESSISTALNSLGKPYSDISIRGKKPSIPLNSTTLLLAQKLLKKGYISSIKEREEKIK